MTDYSKLVKALRCCSKDKCGQCEYEWNQNREFCMSSMCADAAAAIEALQAEIRESMQKCAECGDEQEQKVKKLQAEVKGLKEANNELREAQTYIDHYGDRWMTSAKDVPTAAYEHGYADGRDEAEAQLPKHGEWVEDATTYAGPGLSNYKCSLCGKICGTWRRGLKQDELPNFCGNCGADMRAKMEVQE